MKITDLKMKRILWILLYLPIIGFSQVTDFSNIKTKKKKLPIVYDTTYIQVTASTSEEMKMGLIGQEITIIETNYLNILNVESKNNISHSDENRIKSKIFTIQDYLSNEKKKYYLIRNETGKFLLEDNPVNKFIINSFLIPFKQKYVSKQFYSFKNDVSIQSVDEAEFTINRDDLITVLNIEYLSFSVIDYAMIFIFDNGLLCKFDFKEDVQPKEEGWIYLTNGYKNELFVEKNVLDKFTKDNSRIINDLRNGEIKKGMTEKQCILSWGMPTESYTNIKGYDKVLQYGEINNSQKLYFKRSKLKFIK
jgi:hypothetical protein|tara:strand:+ start:1250 stop:2170 length:921 start_codon:yes stop_codon:yes gene_type:complete